MFSLKVYVSFVALAMAGPAFAKRVDTKSFIIYDNKISDRELRMDITSTTIDVLSGSDDFQEVTNSVKAQLDERYPDLCFTIVVTPDPKDVRYKAIAFSEYVLFGQHDVAWLVTVTKRADVAFGSEGKNPDDSNGRDFSLADKIGKFSRAQRLTHLRDLGVKADEAYIPIDFGAFLADKKNYLIEFTAIAFSSFTGGARYEKIAKKLKEQLDGETNWGRHWNVLIGNKAKDVEAYVFQNNKQWGIWEYENNLVIVFRGCDKEGCSCDN